MSAAMVKGWCPGALRPMQSGDGLVVRVRPFGGRLDAAQISGLAHLAERHGNGLIDVTSRANLQIRGVSESGHRLLLDGLAQLTLLDPDAVDALRSVLTEPAVAATMAAKSRSLAPGLLWPAVAQQYVDLGRALVAADARSVA